jgi:hypothetical protein
LPSSLSVARARARAIKRGLTRRPKPRFTQTSRRGKKRGRTVFNLSARQLKELFFRLCVAGFILLVIIAVWRIFTPGLKIKASHETVAALRVPHAAIGLLESYAAKHEIPFAPLFTLFCAENDFFPEKAALYDLSVLERQYVQDFHAIKRQYDAKNIAPYISMFESLFYELAAFPIPDGWEPDTEPSFMYGDSFTPSHPAADIVDRENIRGRIPVVSMTDGVVQDAGYNAQYGYHTGITTVNGTYYLYAHLDSLAPEIAPGAAVTAGQALGRMGNSGERKPSDALPVHLHISISPITGFSRNRLWVNPYPLLRYVQSKN